MINKEKLEEIIAEVENLEKMIKTMSDNYDHMRAIYLSKIRKQRKEIRRINSTVYNRDIDIERLKERIKKLKELNKK